jgi:hypothetical protein
LLNEQHYESMAMPSLRWQQGQSGNPAGRVRGSRNALSEAVICALLRDFREHGQRAIAKVRETQPGVYLKVLALLVPREHKIEHSNAISSLSDEELDAAIEHIKAKLAARAGETAKVIEGEVVETTALPAPVGVPKPKRRNRVMAAADTAVLGRDET